MMARHVATWAARKRAEAGQSALTLVIVVCLIMSLMVGVLGSQVFNQIPVANEALLTALAKQASEAGVAAYQNLISQAPGDAVAYCSSTFDTAPHKCATIGSTSPGVPGNAIDPAYVNSFTTSASNCSSSNSTTNWVTATVSSTATYQAAYQYVVDSSQLQADSSSGGNVFIYSTGRAGSPGNWICETVKSAIFVQTAEQGSPQTLPVTSTYTNVSTPSACSSPPCFYEVTATVAGASGGAGNSGILRTGGNGGSGEEFTASFYIPAGSLLSDEVGTEGQGGTFGPSSGTGGTGYAAGGNGGNVNNATSGGGGGATALCVFPSNAGSTACTSSVPSCDKDLSNHPVPALGCALAIAAGGGGGAADVGLGGVSGGDGGTGGSPSLAYSSLSNGSVKWTGNGQFPVQSELQTGAAGASSSANTFNQSATGGSGGSWSGVETATGGPGGTGTKDCFGAICATSANGSTGSPASATTPPSSGEPGGNGAQYGGPTFPDSVGADGGGGGGGFAGGGGGAAGGGLLSAGGGGGGGGSSFLDANSLCNIAAPGPPPTGCPNPLPGGAPGKKLVQVGSAPGGNGFVNFYTSNLQGAGLPTLMTTCLNNGGTGTYNQASGQTLCSQPFTPWPVWYTPNASAPNSCVTLGTCTPVGGQLEVCGTSYETQAPRLVTTGQVWLYGGGGGGGYDGAGQGGNGAAAMVDFSAVGLDFYSVNIGCGGGGGSSSAGGTGGSIIANDGTSSATAGGGGGGAATTLCFLGPSTFSPPGAGCQVNETSLCTNAMTAPCIMAIVGGGGGANTATGAGGGDVTVTNWCTANTFSGASGGECNGNAGGSSGAPGGNSWFATGGGMPVAAFQATVCNSTGTGNITSTTNSCLILNSNTDFPSGAAPCGPPGPPTMGESFAQQGTAASPVTNTGEGCGGSPGPASATGYAGFGGQLGYWLASTAGPAIYGWAQWINASTNIESGVCNYTPPSSPPYSWPPEVAYPASSSITVQQSGTYTVDLAGASGAGGWATSGAGNYGTGGPGSTLGFQVPLDQGEQLTFVGGCTGFGDLGGLGFSNGGSSGLAVQDFGQGNAGDSNSNGTPVLTGVGGGGGGSSAVCLTSPSVNAGTSTPTCTAGEPNGSGTNSPTPLCTTTDPSGFSGTCVLAIAGGGGGGGAYGGAVDTGCNGAGNNGNGGLTEGASPGTAFNGYWDGTSYTVGTWWPGSGVPGKPLTNAGAPTAYTNPNPDPTRLNGGYVGNGGNGAYNYHGYPPDPRSGAGGGGGGFVGGWADPWWYGAVPWGQSLPTSADPAAAPVAVNNVTTTSGSNQVTVSGGGFPGVAVGDVVYETNDGPGIPFDTTVTGIDNNNNTLTMSANASASGTVTLHFTPYQTGSGSAGTCGAGGGSSWSFVPNTQVGGNSGSGFATVYYYPPAANQPTTMSPVSIDSTP